MYNIKNFQLYNPVDAEPARLYWSSQDNIDWQDIPRLIDADEIVIVYTHATGVIIAVNPDLKDIVPTGVSILLLDSTEIVLSDNMQDKYIVIGDGLVELDNDAFIAQKWEEIKALRTKHTEGGVYLSTIDKWFHSDMPSKMQVQTFILLLLMGEYQATAWKTMDGSFVNLDAMTLKQLFKELITNELAAFKVAEIHRNLCTNSDNPLAYDTSTMWSPTYEQARG